jgi:hypothetical protein
MQRVFDQFSLLLLIAWVGALWAAGWLVAPLIFETVTDKVLAGNLAGVMFTRLAYFGIVAAFLLLIHRLSVFGLQAFKHGYLWIIIAMLLLILAGQFGIQPILAHLKAQAGAVSVMQSVFSDRFAHWHGIASVAYLMECALGLVLVLKAR